MYIPHINLGIECPKLYNIKITYQLIRNINLDTRNQGHCINGGHGMFIYKEEKQNKAQKYIHKNCPP